MVDLKDPLADLKDPLVDLKDPLVDLKDQLVDLKDPLVDLEEDLLLDQHHLVVLVLQHQLTIQLHTICLHLLLKDKCILEIINLK